MSKEPVYNPALHEKLCAGAESLRRTVERNYGPVGSNTIRDQKTDLPIVANTGRKILPEFSREDPVEDLAAVLLREAALQVASEYGDGSIAVTLLAEHLLSRGRTLTAAGHDPMLLRKGLERALSVIHGLLEKITVPFCEVGVQKLAAAASKNEEVADNVTRAYEFVGQDGVITVQDSQLRETVVHYWDGARFECGLFSTAFINEPERRRAALKEPYVLLSNRKLASYQDIRRLLEEVAGRSGSLLIIAPDISEELLQLLGANCAHGLRVAAVKAPGYGDERRRNMLSLAAKIGSLLFDESTGREMKDCGLEVCSRIVRAEADRNSVLLQGFLDTSAEMTEMLLRHTRQLLEKTADPDEREKLQTTLSILNGKTAEILVGAPIEYEMFEKKYLYENAVRSISNAVRSGLVPGAGNAYLYLARELRSLCEAQPGTEAEGIRCLCDGLKHLAGLLMENAGQNAETVFAQIGTDDPFIGFDVLSGQLADLKQAGILTPADNLEAIIKTAAGTAASLWTAGAAVVSSGK